MCMINYLCRFSEPVFTSRISRFLSMILLRTRKNCAAMLDVLQVILTQSSAKFAKNRLLYLVKTVSYSFTLLSRTAPTVYIIAATKITPVTYGRHPTNPPPFCTCSRASMIQRVGHIPPIIRIIFGIR